MDSRKLPTLKNYEFISVNGIPCNLGFGAYGSVQLGKSLKTGQTVAIKKIGRKMAVGEVEVHMKLNHPNIIKMLDFSFDEKHDCTFIVLEFAENGTLFDYIRENGMKDKVMARGIFHSVCDAVEYLHSKNIMHRDIKPENILLDRKNVVKLCDFGFAVNCEPRMTMCGTVEYMSPQMILRKPYNHKIDIWGLGILFFQMIEGRAPFEGQTQQEVLERMKKPVQFSKNFTANQVELIQKILRVNPNERPQIKQIIKTLSFKNPKEQQESSKRSTTDEEPKVSQKKIKIMEVKDLHNEKTEKVDKLEKLEKLEKVQKTEKVEKTDKLEKTQKSDKKSNFNIEIIEVRNLNAQQQANLTSVSIKTEKATQKQAQLFTNSGGKQKISLKKTSKKP